MPTTLRISINRSYAPWTSPMATTRSTLFHSHELAAGSFAGETAMNATTATAVATRTARCDMKPLGHRGQRRPTSQYFNYIVDRKLRHRRARFGRAASQVGDQRYILERQEIRMDCWFVFIDVERRPGDEVLLKRPRQGGLVDHRAAGRVDQKRRALHARQRPLVDEVPRVGRQRHVQRNYVRCDEQAIERHRLGRAIARSGCHIAAACGERHAHPECGSARGDGSTDPSKADQPELFPAEL